MSAAEERGGVAAVGPVTAVRRFRLDDHHRLRPVVADSKYVWEPGVNTAVCDRRHRNGPPALGHACGLHAVSRPDSLGVLGEVTGVVELSGRVEVDGAGYRAERGEVVALAVAGTYSRGSRGPVVMALLFAIEAPVAALLLTLLGPTLGWPNRSGLVAAVVAAVFGCAVVGTLCVGGLVRRRSAKTLAPVAALYPGVLTYVDEATMLKAHPLTPLPEPPAPSRIDERAPERGSAEFWRHNL